MSNMMIWCLFVGKEYKTSLNRGEMNKEQLTELLKKEVDDKSKEIDPNNEYDWFSLVLGWAIAKNLSINEAIEFSTYIRYETDLC